MTWGTKGNHRKKKKRRPGQTAYWEKAQREIGGGRIVHVPAVSLREKLGRGGGRKKKNKIRLRKKNGEIDMSKGKGTIFFGVWGSQLMGNKKK